MKKYPLMGEPAISHWRDIPCWRALSLSSKRLLSLTEEIPLIPSWRDILYWREIHRRRYIPDPSVKRYSLSKRHSSSKRYPRFFLNCACSCNAMHCAFSFPFSPFRLILWPVPMFRSHTINMSFFQPLFIPGSFCPYFFLIPCAVCKPSISLAVEKVSVEAWRFMAGGAGLLPSLPGNRDSRKGFWLCCCCCCCWWSCWCLGVTKCSLRVHVTLLSNIV